MSNGEPCEPCDGLRSEVRSHVRSTEELNIYDEDSPPPTTMKSSGRGTFRPLGSVMVCEMWSEGIVKHQLIQRRPPVKK